MSEFNTPVEPAYPKKYAGYSPDLTLKDALAQETRIKGFTLEVVGEVDKAIEDLPTKAELATALDALPTAAELAAAVKSILTAIQKQTNIAIPPVVAIPTPPPAVIIPPAPPVVVTLPVLPVVAIKPLVIPTTVLTQDYVPNIQMIGANLCGGEQNGQPDAKPLPRDDAKYPHNEAALKYLAERGFTHIRIPIKWHRIQKTPFGIIEPWHLTECKLVARMCNKYGMTANFDLHDYAERSGPPPIGPIKSTTIPHPKGGMANALLGSPELPTAWLVDFWRKFAAEFKGNPFVHFGLMNEPKCSKEVWWPLAQEIVNTLRADGVKNFITVPGCHWTGAHSWVSSGNATFAERFIDPAKNFAFEVHQYLDSNHSGQMGGMCSPGSSKRLDIVTTWAKAHGYKLYLGEVAAGHPSTFPICGIEFPLLLQVVKDNPAIWAGFAAWHGGAISLTSEFRLEPRPTDPVNTITELTKMIVEIMVSK